LTKAEEVKKIERKVRKGGELTAEDLKACQRVSGELLFGYSENERL